MGVVMHYEIQHIPTKEVPLFAGEHYSATSLEKIQIPGLDQL